MLHAVNRECTLRDCEELFLNHELWASGSDGRPLSQSEARKRVAQDYAAGSSYQRSNPGYYTAADVRAHIGELRALARDWPWRGASGRTDRDVLRFVHNAATWVGCDRINVATRDVSIGAGISQWTAGKSLKRLTAAGWLEKAGDSKPGIAARYKLTRPLKQVSQNLSYDLSSAEDYMSENGTPTEPGHEMWVRLGKTAMDVHAVLDDSPIAAREAARRARAAKSTTCRVLPVLSTHGLAVQTPDGWVRSPLTLDRAAENMGWTGVNSTRTRRALQYEKDRRLQRWTAPALNSSKTH
jgi:hypothetical protein